jgi:sterol desaturase/sphingolipid hydroxylase (fatty acid hydroxylase superfamily)
MTEFLLQIADQWRGHVVTDLTRYAVFAIGVWLVLWVALGGLLRSRKIRAETPPARQLVVELLMSLRSITIFSTVGLSIFLLERAGWLAGPQLAATWGPAWFWASLALMVLGHDAYFYWAHRLMHDPRLFRWLHRRHHRSMNPSPFTAYSFDLGEAAIMAIYVPLWLLLVPTPWPVVGLFMLHQIFRNTMAHSGYELMPADRRGRPLFDWLTTTVHHDLHHAQAGYNFGFYFTFWDRLMGTEHPEYHARFAAVAARSGPARIAAKSVLFTGVVLVSALIAASPARADAVSAVAGDWATPGLGAVVRLEPCAGGGDRLCGRLAWAWDPASLRAGALGAGMLLDFDWRDGAWRGGHLVNPEDGRSYRGEIRPDGRLLRLRGCAGPFCQSQTWRRLADIPRP